MASKHTFEEITDLLPKLEYIPLLKSILQELKKQKIFKFSEDGKRLLIYAYKIAFDIATNSAGKQLNPLTHTVGVRAATVNHESATQFYTYIRAIGDELARQLSTASGEKQAKECVECLCTYLSQFDSKKAALPFNYPFSAVYTLRSQRLSIEDSSNSRTRTGNESFIKAHHLNVRFEGLSQFKHNLLTNLRTYIDTIADCMSEDWEYLNDLLDEISDTEQPKSHLNELRKIVDTESLARLLRDIKIYYLEYLKRESAKTHLINIGLSYFCKKDGHQV